MIRSDLAESVKKENTLMIILNIHAKWLILLRIGGIFKEKIIMIEEVDLRKFCIRLTNTL